MVMPAASMRARRARVVSGGSVRGTWTGLNVMCVTPSVFAMTSARSSGNSRKEYDATPRMSLGAVIAAAWKGVLRRLSGNGYAHDAAMMAWLSRRDTVDLVI